MATITQAERALIRSWEDDRSAILETIAHGVASNLVKLLALYKDYNTNMLDKYASLQQMHADEVASISDEVTQFEQDAVALVGLMMLMEAKQGTPLMGGVMSMMIGAGLVEEPTE